MPNMSFSDDQSINNTHLESLFSQFQDHFTGQRTNTELTCLELLRSFHPDLHVTCTAFGRCDLLGFAKAGHATATLDSGELYDATRSFHPAGGPRHLKEPGFLSDSIRFGRYQYEWNHYKFIIYEIEYTPEQHRRPFKLFYVLAPRSGIEGKALHHPHTDELLLAAGEWSTELHEEVYVFDESFWAKSKPLWKSVQGASWDDVILNQEMKSNLIEDVQGFFDNRELYKSLSVPWKRGLILHGVPGNGKTISIKALINSLSRREEPVPSLYVKNFDACQGQKWSIQAIFSHARIMAPCLLIFEDLDSLVEEKFRSYFLNEVDGLESNDGILMIGSTNYLSNLDPSISKRPSRFDRKYHFKLPNEEERSSYCEFWKRKLEKSPLVDYNQDISPIIAKLTEGFSFAYLKELFVISLLAIARRGKGEEVEEEVEKGKEAEGEGEKKEQEDKDENEDDSGKPISSNSSAIVVEHEDAEGMEPAPNTTSTQNPTLEPKPVPIPTGTIIAPFPIPMTILNPPPKPKRTLPEISIPDHLKDNILLKVIKAQIITLHEEMDSTNESDWPSSKRENRGFGPRRRGPPRLPPGMMLPPPPSGGAMCC